MLDEKREILRFSVCLCVNKINGQHLFGQIKDFSRKGMRVILDTPDIDEKDELRIEIQHPDYNEIIPIISSVIWKKRLESKCEVGLKFKNFPAQAKADFLNYSYKKWLKENPRLKA